MMQKDKEISNLPVLKLYAVISQGNSSTTGDNCFVEAKFFP